VHPTPPPTTRTLAGRSAPSDGDDVLSTFEGPRTPEFRPYGYTKGALRDAIRLLDPPPSAGVLLPSYLPDGVVEPFREAGLDVRFYRIEPDLQPDLDDIEQGLDGRTTAVVAVHYFGFRQPRIDDLRALCEDRGAALVEDTAHSPLSRGGGRLLGTTGDLGVASFHKLFAVPNGAALLIGDATLQRRTDRLELDGIADQYSLGDVAFAGSALLHSIEEEAPSLSGVVASVPPFRERDDDTARDPEAIYRGAKTPMSKLSARILRRMDRRRPVERRRRNYRFWLRALDDVSGVDPVYDALPDGVCPQACPVLVDDADTIAATLDRWLGSCSPWPPLPDEVERAGGFETATRLAERLIRLPVHHGLTEERLRPLARALRRRTDVSPARPA